VPSPQASIIATGNYNFFNLLTAVLCVSLLDDQLLAGLPLVGAPACLPLLARHRQRT
jgi:hypothetical protein